MLSHKQVGWDTVAAGLAISFVTFVKIPFMPSQTLSMILGAICAIFLPPGFGFGPEIFFYLMLPPIILRSGLEFEWEAIKPVWRTTLLFSFFGTVFSALFIFVGCSLYTDLNFHQCSHIGSVLSSTDPVSTMAALKNSNLPQMISNALEGEALTNDAVAAMLTHATNKNSMSTSTTLLDIIVGILTSLSIGAVGGFMFGGFDNTITILGMATSLYACCELLDASGILCIFIFAITSRWRNQPKALRTFVDIIADLADIYCMFAVGTEIIHLDISSFQTSITIFISSVASRIIFVNGLGFAAGEGWKFYDLMFMGFSGARGALSYALARSNGSNIGHIVLCVVLLSTITTNIITNILKH